MNTATKTRHTHFTIIVGGMILLNLASLIQDFASGDKTVTSLGIFVTLVGTAYLIFLFLGNKQSYKFRWYVFLFFVILGIWDVSKNLYSYVPEEEIKKDVQELKKEIEGDLEKEVEKALPVIKEEFHEEFKERSKQELEGFLSATAKGYYFVLLSIFFIIFNALFFSYLHFSKSVREYFES